MALSMQNHALLYRENSCGCRRNHNVSSLGPSRSAVGFALVRGLKRTRLKIKANVEANKIETINGKRVNGSHNVDEIPRVALSNRVNVNDDHESLLGRYVEDMFVYRQSFVIRSYEIGPDKTATMETVMNLLQETALNHVATSGIGGDGFGATREMSVRKLIWVVTRVHVQIERYSSWGDVVEIDTWVDAAGKNGMRRDWIIRDQNTQKIITRATSTWVMMNRETRRLCKIPEEVKNEITPFYLNRAAIASENTDCEKIEKLTDETAQTIRKDLAPRWSDMDANQHVNNVKYIGWILESVPMNVLEHYNMTKMTLEYRRECRQSSVLESLTSMRIISSTTVDDDEEEYVQQLITEIGSAKGLECTHLLRMEADHAEIVRARSLWQLKSNIMF